MTYASLFLELDRLEVQLRGGLDYNAKAAKTQDHMTPHYAAKADAYREALADLATSRERLHAMIPGEVAV